MSLVKIFSVARHYGPYFGSGKGAFQTPFPRRPSLFHRTGPLNQLRERGFECDRDSDQAVGAYGGQQTWRSIAILYVGGVDNGGDRQAAGVGQDMTFCGL